MDNEGVTAMGRHYGVTLVRGPVVRLAGHPEACENEEELLEYVARLRAEGAHLAADLFSGGGGLSLGLEAGGYRVVLSADHDVESVKTHRHHFGGLALDWDLSDAGRVREIARLVSAAGVELLAGGPPCQPFSKWQNKIRHRVYNGLRDPIDERGDLWHSFLEVARLALPSAVVMERMCRIWRWIGKMFVLRTMVHETESLDYAVRSRCELLTLGAMVFLEFAALGTSRYT